ncbi:MAG TPA: 2'-5' RNA ligase family protein [Nocardioides sp.]|uniref:2'-5' RNA ligase family protein n=1 Tax=Nocardioides sp. TaxID=35761 RepID=UPI002F3E6516
MTLAVCLLLDDRADAAVRRLWRRLEDAGVATLLTHTHGLHVPHLTWAALRSYDLDEVRAALDALPEQPPLALHLDAFGTFRRSRCWLAPAVSAPLVERQAAVVAATVGTGAELHRHYEPGSWVPHLTLAPRLHLSDLSTVAALVYDVLPLVATGVRSALIDTSTGARYSLSHPI